MTLLEGSIEYDDLHRHKCLSLLNCISITRSVTYFTLCTVFFRAVGRTYEAVETHMSPIFFEIKQEERPMECALCNVAHGIHAMYPLFDYHGLGGRQICVTKKTKNKNGGKNEKVLVWGHALCALYLASVGFLYACHKDGVFIGMEEGEDDTDSRPPNPELKITSEFQRKYGDAMPHFRYYLTPPNGVLDVWTKSVVENKRELKCIECGLVDDKKSLRIPLQCVANDPDEFSEHKNKHRERNNDTAPCTQALHVGCARWGDPSSSVRKCYYFPGHTNPDGSIIGNVDTVHCLYCRTHAENVDETHQKLIRRDKALLEKKKNAEKERLAQKMQHRTMMPSKCFPKAGSTSKNRIQHQSPTPTYPKRHVSMMKGTNYTSKSADNRAPVALSKGNRAWGKYKNREQDRYKELDPSVAVAINAGQQPTLAKRRRQIANDRSIVTKEDIEIFNDLVSHREEVMQNPVSVINSRKRHWKHEFSGLSTTDFDSIWIRARKRFVDFQNRRANIDSSKSNTPPGIILAPISVPIDLSNPSADNEEGAIGISTQEKVSRNKHKNVELKSNSLGSDGDSVVEIDFNSLKHEELGVSEANINNQKSCKKSEKKQTGERPTDRWSKLFIGQPFEMGYEFTLDKLGKNG